MPLDRPTTAEEDITHTITTMVMGLNAKYGKNIDAKNLFSSIIANVCICVDKAVADSGLDKLDQHIIRSHFSDVATQFLKPQVKQ